MVQQDKFRTVMGHFPTGVTVVTTRDSRGEPLGLTVSAFTSVSLEPELILICVHKDAGPHDALLERGSFAVNVLSAEQDEVAIRFATGPTRERFRGVESREGPLGNPIFPCLAWLACEVREVWPGGDHSVILARVRACDAREGEPLLWFRGKLEGWPS